jgi:alanine-glyoxylate transaminase/serine-glyoxylate transaminase/serine-pyruvate transaminase
MTPSTVSPPTRNLLGPGPSNVPPSVIKAMQRPQLGHLDPAYLGIMDEIQAMLRAVFITENEITFPVSGTGSAGMEFCLVNLIEPGDEVIIGVNGYFGGRLADIATRCGAKVTTVESDWGDIIRPEQIANALETVSPKLVAIVHAETSTGVLTPVEEISRLAHEAGALIVLDTVTSLGGCPVRIDDWQIDAAYSASQKCLGSACGVAPVTLSPRAMETVAKRKTPVQSFYLDVTLLQKYWAGSPRAYHHTAPILMNYALHEALRLVLEEGLEARWARHEANHRALAEGLAEQGLELAAPEAIRLWQLNPVRVPEGVDEAAVRLALLNDHNLEVGPGLGPLKGKVWRVGLMGHSSQPENVRAFLSAMETLLAGAAA